MAVNPADHQLVLQRFMDLGLERLRLLDDAKVELVRIEKALRSYRLDLVSSPEDLEKVIELQQRIVQARDERIMTKEYILELESSSTVPTDLATAEAFQTQQFTKICELSRVQKIFLDASDNSINVVVTASYVYNCVEYDLGDWRIVFGDWKIPGGFDVVNYRNTNRKPEWGLGAYPDYTMSDDQFCLGAAMRSIVGRYINDEHYLQAIQLIIFAVNSVNENDVAGIPAAFYPVMTTYGGTIQCVPFLTGPTTSI